MSRSRARRVTLLVSVFTARLHPFHRQLVTHITINLDKYSKDAEDLWYSNYITYIRVRVCFGVDIWDLLTAVITLRVRTHDASGSTVQARSPLPLRRLRTSYEPLGASTGSPTALCWSLSYVVRLC
jgi:hypothetical protein